MLIITYQNLINYQILSRIIIMYQMKFCMLSIMRKNMRFCFENSYTCLNFVEQK